MGWALGGFRGRQGGPWPGLLPSAGRRASGTRSDEGWGPALRPLPTELSPAPPPAPLAAAGVAACSREHLETGLLGNTAALPCAVFLQAGQGGPVPGCGMWAPSQRPKPAPRTPRTVASSEGTDSRSSKFLPAPEALSRPAPGTRGVRGPQAGPSRRVERSQGGGLFSTPGAGMFPDGGSRLPRPPQLRPHSWWEPRPALRAFSTLWCQHWRARAGEDGFHGNLTFCYFLFSFLWFLQL